MKDSSAPDAELLSIGEAARILGVSVSTLRKWDREGLIHSTRTLGDHRRYTRDEIRRAASAFTEAS